MENSPIRNEGYADFLILPLALVGEAMVVFPRLISSLDKALGIFSYFGIKFWMGAINLVDKIAPGSQEQVSQWLGLSLIAGALIASLVADKRKRR